MRQNTWKTHTKAIFCKMYYFFVLKFSEPLQRSPARQKGRHDGGQGFLPPFSIQFCRGLRDFLYNLPGQESPEIV